MRLKSTNLQEIRRLVWHLFCHKWALRWDSSVPPTNDLYELKANKSNRVEEKYILNFFQRDNKHIFDGKTKKSLIELPDQIYHIIIVVIPVKLEILFQDTSYVFNLS